MKNVVLMILFISTICGCKNLANDDCICKCLLFPTSDNGNCYWIEVSKSKEIKISYGDLDWDFHQKIADGLVPDSGISWERLKIVESISVCDSVYCSLIELVSQVEQRKNVNLHPIADNDGQGVALFVKNRQFYYTYGDYSDEPTESMLRLLKSVCSIPRQDWEAIPKGEQVK